VQQTEIKLLLEELAKPECSFSRHQEVSRLFHQAAKRRPAPDSTCDDTSLLFSTMLNRLLQIVNAKHLPGLFPVFAMLCGDYEGIAVLADIDWDLLS
jgi:hypothetical protein